MTGFTAKSLRGDIEALFRTYDEVSHIWPASADPNRATLGVLLRDGRRVDVQIIVTSPTPVEQLVELLSVQREEKT